MAAPADADPVGFGTAAGSGAAVTATQEGPGQRRPLDRALLDVNAAVRTADGDHGRWPLGGHRSHRQGDQEKGRRKARGEEDDERFP